MPDTPQDKYVAIEIDSREVWDLICGLEPHFAELDYEFNKGFFVVFNHVGMRWQIMSPETAGVCFDHIEPNDLKIKLVSMVNEDTVIIS
jgi:hypothetical protein